MRIIRKLQCILLRHGVTAETRFLTVRSLCLSPVPGCLQQAIRYPAPALQFQPTEQVVFCSARTRTVVRTMFLLRYISDLNLCHTVQTATTKSECFNALCNGSHSGAIAR